MRKHGLPELAALLGGAADLFVRHTDSDPPTTWGEFLWRYDPADRLSDLQHRIGALDNYGLAEATIAESDPERDRGRSRFRRLAMATDTGPKYFGFAPLNDQQLSELMAVENDLGVTILAFKPNVPPPMPLANLTPEQIGRLQQFEQQHGVITLACRNWKKGMA
jgi:hypothetical protein